MWVLVSPITESGYILSVSVCHQEQALSWRNSRCLKPDKSKKHHRAPGYTVLMFPQEFLLLNLKCNYFVSEKIQEIFRDIDV